MMKAQEEVMILTKRIDDAYNFFDNIPPQEHELIDSAIYTINALEAQRRYVINQERKKVF